MPKTTTAEPDAGAPEVFYRQTELLRMLRISRPTLWAWRRDPKVGFPAAIRLSTNTIVWRAGDVKAWLDSRPAA